MPLFIDIQQVHHNAELEISEYQVVVLRKEYDGQRNLVEVIGHYYESGNEKEADVDQHRLTEYLKQGAEFSEAVPHIISSVAGLD